MNQPVPDTPFLDTQGIAEYLGVNEKQVYTLIHERGLPATKITGKWLFPVHLVDRWLESAVINMPEQLPFLQETKQLMLIAGSDDPLFLKTLALFRHRNPDILTLQSRTGSTDGLVALSKGLVHIACAHLVDREGRYSPDHIRELGGSDIAVVTFAARTQGVLLGPDNPHGVESFEGLIGKPRRWAVRELGTGTRALMERELDLAGKQFREISGETIPCDSHLDVALAVLSGRADAGIAIETVARMVGLPFIPMRQERFDLAIRKEVFFLDQAQKFIGLLGTPEFAALASQLGGYDTADSGRIVTG
ncbi:MAG: helix-turn-helix transcriptional regulator [bacterium]|nr:helix-turn-helix transcriptional regulator [bacterium]MDT8396671.1 helix-turn-helix transcriptional regulator [bacterium]